VLLRASTSPGDLDLPRDLDLSDASDGANGLAWLVQVWRRPEVRDALRVASPVLCRQVDAALDGPSPGARRVRRLVLAVALYLLRWEQRATPFGLFAGVVPARIGTEPRVSWRGAHRVVVRADADWLAGVIDRLHRCPELVEHLTVVANDAGQVRGDRYVAPGSPASGDGQSLAPVEVSVRHTRPVAAALDAACVPIRYGELRGLLADRFPATAASRIEEMLSGLIGQGMLITSLNAPMTSVDALGHLRAVLEAAGVRDIGEVAHLVRELFAIHDELGDDRVTGRPEGRAALAGRMTSLSGGTVAPLIAEVALDCDIQIPEQVAREAQEAFGVLCRLTPHPYGPWPWRDYHARFRARYGAGAVVPVLDLVADSGLGLPAGFLGSGHGRAVRPLTARDEKVFGLIQRAMLDGREEIVLDDAAIADLASGEDANTIDATRAELAVQIHAASLDALTRGRFRLLVTGTPSPASSMAGRFAHLLPADFQARLAATYLAGEPDAVVAQLSFAPRRRRNENIARTTRLLPHVISVSEHREPCEDLIRLADLAVTADACRFWLVQLSTGARVVPRVLHALEASAQTPALARFLAEISTARSAACRSFDFGAAAHLPYLPRVRYHRTILAPARWLLTASELPAATAALATWEAGFDAWLARLRAPRHLTLVQHEQRLPLDLGHPLHRLLLRTRLDRAGQVELREAPAPHDLAWIGRAHELLLPMTVQRPTGPSASPCTRPARVAAEAGFLPGRSAVLCAQIHGHYLRYEEILAGYLPDLLEAFDPPPRWWFRRHQDTARPDTDQYIDVCLRLPGYSEYGQVAGTLSDWAERLRTLRLISHLTLATHEPQTGRFGHGLAMAAAEACFAADSVAVLAQIAATASSGIDAQALAAASMLDIAVCYAPAPHAGLAWLTGHLPREHGYLDRALRDQALELADPNRAWRALRALPGGPDVMAAWQDRAATLTAYREHLSAQRDPLTALRSLLHLHHVRALPVDPDLERVTGRLVRTCVLRHVARPET
jgi:thiopeptide-type bacteriocin biosynthesis protein